MTVGMDRTLGMTFLKPLFTSHRAQLFWNVLTEIADECDRQDQTWGIQDHPSVFPCLSPEDLCRVYAVLPENLAKEITEINRENGTLTWAHIMNEEWSEAISAGGVSEQELRNELIQVAAVAIQWVMSLDRQNGRKNEKG